MRRSGQRARKRMEGFVKVKPTRQRRSIWQRGSDRPTSEFRDRRLRKSVFKRLPRVDVEIRLEVRLEIQVEIWRAFCKCPAQRKRHRALARFGGLLHPKVGKSRPKTLMLFGLSCERKPNKCFKHHIVAGKLPCSTVEAKPKGGGLENLRVQTSSAQERLPEFA